MQILLTYKSKQFFWLLIKLSIVFGCVFFIYQKLFLNTALGFSTLKKALINHNFFSLEHMLILFSLTSLNWFFEILKWKQLVNLVQNISLFEASKQCLSSLTTSLITPNRIGEYGAKAIYFKKSLRKKILGFTFIGNFYQLVATLFFGIVGFAFFTTSHKISINFKTFYVIIAVFVLLFCIFFMAIKSFKIIGKYWKKTVTFLKSIPFSTNLKILSFSIVRYLLFSHQFYILMVFFSIEISYINAITSITSVYLIASIVPILSFLDVVLKGTIAVWIFSFFQISTLTILTIVSLLWFFNFAIPALIGSYFIITFKPIKKV